MNDGATKIVNGGARKEFRGVMDCSLIAKNMLEMTVRTRYFVVSYYGDESGSTLDCPVSAWTVQLPPWMDQMSSRWLRSTLRPLNSSYGWLSKLPRQLWESLDPHLLLYLVCSEPSNSVPEPLRGTVPIPWVP